MAPTGPLMGDLRSGLRIALTVWLNDQMEFKEGENQSREVILRGLIVNDKTPVMTVIKESIQDGQKSLLAETLFNELLTAAGLPQYEVSRLKGMASLLGWEAILDTDLVEAYQCCQPYDDPRDHYSGRPTYQVQVYGFTVLTLVHEIAYGYQWIGVARSRRLAEGYGLRFAEVISRPDNEKEDYGQPAPNDSHYDRTAKRKLIKAGLAEIASLPFGQHLVSVDCQGHPALERGNYNNIIWV